MRSTQTGAPPNNAHTHRFSKAAGRPVFGKPQLAAVQGLLHQPHCVGFCALVREHAKSGGSEQLVGAVTGCVTPQLEGDWCLELVSCVVRADWRSRGVGKQLVGALLSSTGSSSERASRSDTDEAALPLSLRPTQQPTQQVPSTEASEACCWVPRSHPLNTLLSCHFGFSATSESDAAHTPEYALPGSQPLTQRLSAHPVAAGPPHSHSPPPASEATGPASTSRSTASPAAASTASPSKVAATCGPPNAHPRPPTQLPVDSEGARGGVAVRRITESDVGAAVAMHQSAVLGELGGKPVFPARLMPTLEVSVLLDQQMRNTVIMEKEGEVLIHEISFG